MLLEFQIDFEVEDVPDMKWEEVAEAPVARLDGAAVQIGGLLYVFAGYASIDEVGSSFALNFLMELGIVQIPRDPTLLSEHRHYCRISEKFSSHCRWSIIRAPDLCRTLDMWEYRFHRLPSFLGVEARVAGRYSQRK